MDNNLINHNPMPEFQIIPHPLEIVSRQIQRLGSMTLKHLFNLKSDSEISNTGGSVMFDESLEDKDRMSEYWGGFVEE